MKIRDKDKTKDYFDIYANNPKLSDMAYTWVRTQESVKTNYSLPVHFDWNLINGSSIYGFMIAFCGSLIPVLAVEKPRDWFVYDFYYRISDIPENLLADLKNPKLGIMGAWKQIQDLFGITSHPWITQHDTHRVLNRVAVLEIHRRLKTPVFVNNDLIRYGWDNRIELNRAYLGQDNSAVFTNPNLKAFQFYKYMDAFTCFQKLEQFVCNELAESVDNKANVKIPDVLKAESHGFNKYSFRKDKVVK